MKTNVLAIACACAALSASLAQAKSLKIEGVPFVDEVTATGTTLGLNGLALLRYKYIFKAYVAALYLGRGATPEQVLSDVPKRLEIQYFYGIKGPDFAWATNEGIAANVDAGRVAALRPRIDRLNGLYRDVSPGDRYALTYVPGAGTELALNGKPLGTIEGADFASALFAIWLGPNAIDASLKKDLLSKAHLVELSANQQ